MLFAIECIAKHTNLDIPLLDIYDRHSDLFLRFPSGSFRGFLNLLCNFGKNRSAEYSKLESKYRIYANSFHTFMYCDKRSQYIRPNSKKNSFRENYSRKYGNFLKTRKLYENLIVYFLRFGSSSFLLLFDFPIKSWLGDGVVGTVFTDSISFDHMMSHVHWCAFQ